jgi:hypothetical protein
MAQAAFAFDDTALPSPPAGRAEAPSAAHPADHDDAGFELGQDFARHGLLPPAEHLLPANPLRQGWEAGRRRFATRPLPATATVQQWLQLRLQAWMAGRAFEAVQVTPHYLAQIDTPRCPITRSALTRGAGAESDATITRVFKDAGYAAGNLAVLSQRAASALAELRWDEARLLSVLAEARQTGLGAGSAQGLRGAEWARLATLMSFVTPLPHALAATLPLRVLPPNRLRLLNPIQGLQALITRLLTHAGYAERSRRLAELIDGPTARQDYQLVFLSLLPRAWDGGRPGDEAELRERLEDAWRDPQLLRRWQRFARHFSAAQAEDLVQRAVAAGLAGKACQVQVHGQEQATEGWALETGGYQPAARPRRGLARHAPWPGLSAAA